MEEVWKDIVGYEGLYQISNLGRVKSLNYKHTGKERILKDRKTNKGYLRAVLYKEGKQKQFLVHRLVAEAFVPNPENKPCIDHIDTNPLNNVCTNLRWVTQKENCNNSLSKEHYSKTKKGKKRKPFSEEHKKHISEAMSGENNPNYGKHHSEETKVKMSEAKQGKYDGENNPRARKVYCLETGKTYNCISDASRELGVNHISDVCNGKLKQTHGYHFYYTENIIFMN